MTQPIRARYLRIALPGSVRDLSLSEVQIMSAGVNVARGARATQSSVVAGGTVGGQASAAIDGNSDGGEASASFTNDQRDPWWEIDLGEPRAIDSVTLWNRTDVPPSTRDGFHLSVMDAERQPVAILDGLRSADPTVTIDIGGDYGPRVMRAAINALAHVPNRHADIFRLLVGFIERGGSQRAAIDAVRRIPRASWPAEGLGALARGVVRYAQSVPASERTDAAFAEVIAFGRELARDLPAADRSAISAALDDATVRVIQIKAKVGAMQWEVRQFSVQPNELVEIEIVNPDIMPHNLLITAPGKLEAVGRAAEAMAALPDAFERQFVPDTPDVLFKTRLINANQTDRLRFRAPSQPGAYPYVCSFPGHWQTMNGVMTVNAGSGRRGGRPAGPPSSQGSRGGGPPGGVAITPAR
jgi:azurin